MTHYVYQKWWVRLLIGGYDFAGNLLAKRKRQPLRRPRRVMILALHQIGDVILSLPTIIAIHEMIPDAEITVVMGRGPAELFDGKIDGIKIQVFDAVWQKITRQLLPHKTDANNPKETFLRMIDSFAPDVVIAIQPDLRVNQLLGQRRIPVTLGFDYAGGSFLLTDSVTPELNRHQAEIVIQLAEQFAQIFELKLPRREDPKLLVAPGAKKKIVAKLAEAKIDANRLVVIHPFPSVPARAWLPEHWSELVDWLIEQKLTPVIIGGPKDNWSTKSNEVINWIGQLSLPETVALLAEARACIAVNSGPGHIAAAVQTPLISIFSSANDPKRWAALGKQVTVLHVPVKDRRRYPLENGNIPAGELGNPYSEGITVEIVKGAVMKIIERKR